MNDHPNDSHLDDLEGPLRQAVERVVNRPVPENSLLRAIGRAETVGDRPRPSRPRRRVAWVAAGLAAAAAVVLWALQPTTGWAQVADALKAHPWVHGTAKQPDGTSQEFWFSAARGVSASRHGDAIDYDDHRLGVRYSYDAKEQAIYRMPQDVAFAKQEMNALRDVFDQLVSKEDRLRSPLAGTEVVQQERRRVVVDGQTWTEYDLTLRHAVNDELLRVVFRVPPGTLLPQSMRLTPLGRSAHPPLEFALEYPAAGPVDAYALGVPRAAKFVDRVPPEDLDTVLKGMRLGRQRFGAYHAIAAETAGNMPPWQSMMMGQVWRKGNRWRVEVPAGMQVVREPPAVGTDMAAWWAQRCQQSNFVPVSACNGKAVYAQEVLNPPAAGKPDRKWKELWRIRPDQDAAPSVAQAARYLPELFAYPDPVGPSAQFAATLDRAPKDGPPGTLLVTAQAAGSLPQARMYRRIRYWVDPQHGYATLQQVIDDGPDDAGVADNKPRQTNVMERLEQTPSGVWYPTLVRMKFASVNKPGEKPQASPDLLTWFYLDFKAELPDRLFEPRDR